MTPIVRLFAILAVCAGLLQASPIWIQNLPFENSARNPNWTIKGWDGSIDYFTVYPFSALTGRREFAPNFDYAWQLWAGTISNNSGAGDALQFLLACTGTSKVTAAFFDQITSNASPDDAPEPATLWFAIAGGIGLLAWRSRANQAG